MFVISGPLRSVRYSCSCCCSCCCLTCLVFTVFGVVFSFVSFFLSALDVVGYFVKTSIQLNYPGGFVWLSSSHSILFTFYLDFCALLCAVTPVFNAFLPLFLCCVGLCVQLFCLFVLFYSFFVFWMFFIDPYTDPRCTLCATQLQCMHRSFMTH